MKYFLDTEFAEQQGSIDLISIGIVAEDGREFYAETNHFDRSKCNDWVRANVLPHLWNNRDSEEARTFIKRGGYGGNYSLYRMGGEVLRFVKDEPEFWGYYCAYDWAALCWLFGDMEALPDGWPMHCNDLRQLALSKGDPDIPKMDSLEHHALNDARWNKQTYYFLENL